MLRRTTFPSHYLASLSLRRHRGSTSKMSGSTFTLPHSSTVVSLPSNLTREQLLCFPAFKHWISTLQASLALQKTQKNHEFHKQPYELGKIEVQAVDWFGPEKLGFVKLIADVENLEGETLPSAVFLRGGSVGMMVRRDHFIYGFSRASLPPQSKGHALQIRNTIPIHAKDDRNDKRGLSAFYFRFWSRRCPVTLLLSKW